MKARVKATGEIIEVEEYHKYLDTGWEYRDNTGTLYKPSALDFSVEAVVGYWERLKHQYAGMAMQGLIASNLDLLSHEIIEDAISYAHALVEKMKEVK